MSGASEAISVPAVPRERYWLHILLFLLTLLSTTIVGTAMQLDFNRNTAFDLERSLDVYGWAWHRPALLLEGLPFSLTLLAILLAHELGHYLTALYHGVDASPPYFIPSPVLGTFGAFIRVRSQIYSKLVLFDIGISGPIAGFVVLLPALAIGLAYSKVIPGVIHQSPVQFGVPALQWLLERAIFPGTQIADINLHPVGRAAWIGMFATAMNLLPVGQLDGGHILYSFFPGWHRTVSVMVCIFILPLGFLWKGWALWAVLLLWLGRRHPMVYDTTPLTPGRKWLGMAAAVLFILCFIYAPMTEGGL